MKTKLTLLALLISIISMAQNGINYKALIKDANGNIIANQSIDIVFSIQHESVIQFSELQQIVTDDNGIAIATIGEGSVITSTFDAIDWELRQLELNVQIDLGNGLVDFGNSPFNAVPYAIETLNKDGLTAINEGNGIGWRLAGVITDGEEGYGDIGNNATDLSVSDANGASLIYPYGATGIGSFATGVNTIAFGDYANAIGFGTLASGARAFASGRDTQASGSNSTAMGVFSNASGEVSFAIGASAEASGNYASAIGRGSKAESSYSTVIGRYNFGGGNNSSWIESDPLFEIGNGTSDSNRSNALTVYKNGQHIINSSSTGLSINSENFGLIINETLEGIYINNAEQRGIRILNPGADGIYVTGADDKGGYFSGTTAGIHAESSSNSNPDIILGGNSSANDSDDGIISTDPSYINGDMYLRTYDALVVELDYDNNNAGNFIVKNGTGNNLLNINESGNATLSGSLTQNSDRRLKKDIENLDYGLKEILQLQPKQYFWKNQEQDKKKSLGLIAQDVQSIISEIVTSQDDELRTLGISYTELIPVLINAIKEQNKIIESQGDALKASNTNYEALLSRIEQLEANTSN